MDLLSSPVQNRISPDWQREFRPLWVRPPAAASYAMNGLLEQWPSTAVAKPAELISFSAPWGGTAIDGSFTSIPFLWCQDPHAPCVYQPPRKGCDGKRNGEWSGYSYDPDANLHLRPSFGNGGNFAYADGHAGFRRMFGVQRGKTDYRTDPYLAYDAQGRAHGMWFDPEACHALLFRPDFDFENYGDPVAITGP